MVEVEPYAMPSPDEATQRDQIRRLLVGVIAIGMAAAVLQLIGAGLVGSGRWLAGSVLIFVLVVWAAVVPLRMTSNSNVTGIVTMTASGIILAAVGMAILEPFLAFVVATSMLTPIALALPYLEGRRLRRMMAFAMVAMMLSALAGFLPGDEETPAAVIELMRYASLLIVLGAVTFLMYRSSERLKASSREFNRLVRLSSDLAETSDPAVLGTLVARHLAAAIEFDECILYALEAETGRLVPFGSYPVERALETAPESIAERPVLARVVRDRTHVLIDVADMSGDPDEQARLRRLGREVMLELPLVAPTGPVGVAELTTTERHLVDERRIALLRTLAFEAAMAIENGRLYQDMRHRALHDPLTGLANASLFHDRVGHALERLVRRQGATVAILFGDLDDFKAVNDRLGHAAGDRLLAIVADRLRAAARPEDTVARLGGDEFGLLLEELPAEADALAIAERAIAAVAAPIELAGEAVTASLSIGVAFRAVQGVTVDALIGEADTAMYEAKAAGKRRVVRFKPPRGRR